MAEITSITWTYQELVEMLIKAANIHEGTWMPQIQFGLAAGNFGPSPPDVVPGAAVLIQKIGIQRAPEPIPPGLNLAVDAAKVNPRKEPK
ncbi:MAG: hypothetical protein HY423_12755 [Candidatus Lambdaproteobacteria bacterium]|nr:hypothetical protein [Candidatus Lambdaproteobacteria bacterium]